MTEKYFLLLAGERYYPSRGTGDWIDTYASKEEAEAEIEKIKFGRFIIKNADYDWYQIVDLRDWIFKE